MLRNAYHLLLGLLALPFLFLLQFRTMWAFTKSLFDGLTDVSLSEPEHHEKIAYDTVDATPSMKQRFAVAELCQSLIEAEDWVGLSEKLTHWDQTREKSDAGYALASTARDTVLNCMAEAVVEGHTCHPDPILIFADETVEFMETLVEKHPECYPLLALAADMRCYQGWVSRGADYSQYVTDDGWFGMAQHFAKAQALLDTHDPVAMNAPLLAAVRHKLLAFMPDADKHVGLFYEQWSDLDLVDQEPHAKHAIMMLPRWFGSEQTLEIEAQKAAIRTAEVTGDAAYFSMYRRAFDAWDPSILNLDTQALGLGAHDLITLRNDDPAVVAEVIQKMLWWTAIGSDRDYSKSEREIWSGLAAEIDEIRRDITMNRLLAICPAAWEGGVEDALDTLSFFIQDDIKAGSTFRLGKTGFEIFPHASGQMARPA
ncbi:MAG: hypothetical protein AAF681_00010 [Pseudomonadota bacterium]